VNFGLQGFLGLLPTDGLLGTARPCFAWSAGNFPDSDSAAGGGIGAKNLVEGHVLCRFLDFGDSWLTCMDSACKVVLGQFHGFTLPPDRQGSVNTKIEHLPLFVRHGQEVGGIPELPSSRFQRFLFLGLQTSTSP